MTIEETRRRRRSVGVVALGGALSTAITFGSSVVISRIFTPADFGVFSTLIALVMTLSTMVSGRLEMAVPLPPSDRLARQLMVIGAAISSLVAMVILAGSLILTRGLDLNVWLPSRVAGLLWTVPLLLVPVAGFQLLNAWALRDSRFSAVARRTVLQSLVTASVQIGFGALGMGVAGLLLGYFLGQTMGCLSLLFGATLRGREGETTRWRETLSRFRRFPLVLMPAGLLNSLGIQAPILLIAGLYGPYATGIYGLTQRVLAVPVVLITQATSSVYSSELAKIRRNHQDGALAMFYSTTRHLALISVVLVPLVMLLSPWGFSLIFGETWRQSGELTRAMAIPLGVLMVSAPVSQTLIVFELSALQLGWDAARLIAIIGTFILMHGLGAELITTIWVYSVVSTLFYTASWLLARRTLQTYAPARLPTRREQT